MGALIRALLRLSQELRRSSQMPGLEDPGGGEIGALHALSPLSARQPRGLSLSPALCDFSREQLGQRFIFQAPSRPGKGDCVFVYWRGKFKQKGKSFLGNPSPRSSLALGKCALRKDVGRTRNGNPESGRLTQEKQAGPKNTRLEAARSRQPAKRWTGDPAKRWFGEKGEKL